MSDIFLSVGNFFHILIFGVADSFFSIWKHLVYSEIIR